MLSLGLVLLSSGIALAGVSVVEGSSGESAAPAPAPTPIVAPKSLFHQLQEAKAESTGGGAVSNEEMNSAMTKLRNAVGQHNQTVEQTTGVKAEPEPARAPSSAQPVNQM